MSHRPPIDSCLSCHVPYITTAIRATAPRRSNQRARLRSSHHKRTAPAAKKDHCMPVAKPVKPGTTAFTPNRARNSRTTVTTPGHTRSGLRGFAAIAFVLMLDSPLDRVAPAAYPRGDREAHHGEYQPCPEPRRAEESQRSDRRQRFDRDVPRRGGDEGPGEPADEAIPQP